MAIPYAQVCDVFCRGNQRPSLLDNELHEVSWLAAEPALAALLTVVAALALLVVRQPVDRAVAAAVLTIAGALTFAFFSGLIGIYSFIGLGGPVIGAIGGLIITIAGVASPSPAGGNVKLRILVAALTFVGCAVDVKAFTVPYAEFCDAAPACPFDNNLPSLISDVNHEVSPLIAVPGLALAVAVALLLLRGPVAGRMAAVALGGAGVVALAFFVSLVDSYNPGRPGSVLGAFGALLITLAGVIGVTSVFRTRSGSP